MPEKQTTSIKTAKMLEKTTGFFTLGLEDESKIIKFNEDWVLTKNDQKTKHERSDEFIDAVRKYHELYKTIKNILNS